MPPIRRAAATRRAANGIRRIHRYRPGLYNSWINCTNQTI